LWLLEKGGGIVLKLGVSKVHGGGDAFWEGGSLRLIKPLTLIWSIVPMLPAASVTLLGSQGSRRLRKGLTEPMSNHSTVASRN
jgi:hypothetical protein